MPNGGRHACGSCWFYNKNNGAARMNHLGDSGEKCCTIRNFPIAGLMYTVCANHPFTNPDKLDIPIGPVFTFDSEGWQWELYKSSPNAKKVRDRTDISDRLVDKIIEKSEEHLEDFLPKPGALSPYEPPHSHIPDVLEFEKLLGTPHDERIIQRHREFKESRAIQHLERIAMGYLEKAFRKKAAKEGSIYLPRIVPEFPVDFIFVGMEPSLGSWVNTKGKSKSQIKEAAEKKIGQGFIDFAWSMGDFILHYCIREYCGRSYYITNISKGAMTVDKAHKQRLQRYAEWYPLFVEELMLASRENTKIVVIGQEVKKFLEAKGHRGVYSILHYSQQAAGYRGRHIKGIEPQFDEFAKTVSRTDIIDVARCIIHESRMSRELREEILAKLMKPRDADLSLSQKRLIFEYKLAFKH